VVILYKIYTVSIGDTIESIANQFGTSEGVLDQINGFDKGEVLVPGKQIIVPVREVQPYRYYTVKKGDNLYQIARDNDIDYQMLLQLNGLDDNDYIYPNQTLLLPKEGLRLYLTKNDDTLGKVLESLNISIDDLLKENENIYLRPEQIIVFRNN